MGKCLCLVMGTSWSRDPLGFQQVPERVARIGSCRVLRHRRLPACDVDIVPGEPAEAADVCPLRNTAGIVHGRRPHPAGDKRVVAFPLHTPSQVAFELHVRGRQHLREEHFLTKSASARPTAPAASGNAAVDKPAQADDGGASSSPSRGSWVTSVIAALVISTVFFAI